MGRKVSYGRKGGRKKKPVGCLWEENAGLWGTWEEAKLKRGSNGRGGGSGGPRGGRRRPSHQLSHAPEGM